MPFCVFALSGEEAEQDLLEIDRLLTNQEDHFCPLGLPILILNLDYIDSFHVNSWQLLGSNSYYCRHLFVRKRNFFRVTFLRYDIIYNNILYYIIYLLILTITLIKINK